MATIGIDLGTFNSAVSTMLPNGKIVLLQAAHGPTAQGTVIPSFLKFLPNGELEKYGESAREDLAIAPQLVVWGVKRLLGRDYAQVKLKGELERFRYPIVEGKDGAIEITIGKKAYSPLEITTLFLKRIKEDAESPFNPLGVKITKAIITRPAFFDTYQIEATKEAALAAGFAEVELITEPEAAACAYEDSLDFNNSPWVMVVDWGAGTLDIVITRFSLNKESVPKITSIFPPYGDTSLGGIDMDKALFDAVVERFQLTDLDPVTHGRLSSEIEKGKIYLSTNFWVKRFFLQQGKNRSLFMARTKEDLPPGEDHPESWICIEEVLADILQKLHTHLEFALKNNGLTPVDIDQLILVGGPMYMPCVRKAIAKVFSKNSKLQSQFAQIEKEGFPVSPLEAVVYGAVVKKSGYSEGLDRLPYGYGYIIDEYLADILIADGTVLPETGTLLTRESPGINNPNLEPGAAMQISLLKKVVTPEGEKYYKTGRYEFVPIVSKAGTSFKPVLEIDHDGIISLKIVDYYSKTPEAFCLNFSHHQEIEIQKPESFLSENAAANNAGSSARLNSAAAGGYGGGGGSGRGQEIDKALMIPKEKVKVLADKGQAYLKFVDSMFIERDFSGETIALYEQLKTALLDFPLRDLSPDEQSLFQMVHRTCELLRNQLIVAEDFTESEITALL